MSDFQAVSEATLVQDNDFYFEVDSGDMSPQLCSDYHSFDPDISDLWEK